MGRGLADYRNVVAAFDGDVEADPTDGLSHIGVQRLAGGNVRMAGDQYAQRQPPPDDHLLDVQQVHGVPGEHFEER